MAAARAAKEAKRQARLAEQERDERQNDAIDATALHIDDETGLSATRRAAVASARGAARKPVQREPLREPMRSETGRVMVRGRDGQMLTRKRTNTGDKFHVDPRDIPEGWTYQWIAESVFLNSDKEVVSTVGFYENGWTPVPAQRHEGQFMPVGYKGHIRREGLILVERPKELTDEARDEEIAAAKNLIRTQNEQFQPRLPGARAGQRGTGLQARRSIEGLPPDIGRPQYEIAVDDGLV
jgi:hypothetical protein